MDTWRLLLLVYLDFMSAASAFDDMELSSPGNVCTCKGQDVTLNWKFAHTDSIGGYMFCYNPTKQEQVECEKIILYKEHNMRHMSVSSDYEGKTLFVSNNTEHTMDIGIQLSDVTDTDSAIYSVILERFEQESWVDNNCKLSVVEGVNNISFLIRQINTTRVNCEPLNPIAQYVVEVFYDGDVPADQVAVTLNVNGTIKRKQSCPSPCRFMQNFSTGYIAVDASVAGCGCYTRNNKIVQVMNLEREQSLKVKSYQLSMFITTPILIVFIILLGIVSINQCLKRRRVEAGRHNSQRQNGADGQNTSRSNASEDTSHRLMQEDIL